MIVTVFLGETEEALGYFKCGHSKTTINSYFRYAWT